MTADATDAAPPEAACSIQSGNIGRKQRRRRLIMGFIVGTLAIAATVTVVALGWDRIYRVALYPLFSTAGIYFFQVREKT